MKHFNNPERYQSMQPFYFLLSRSMTSATIRSDHPAKTTTARSRENNGGKIQLFQNSSHMRRQNAPLLRYLMKNYGDQGECYLSRSEAEVDNTLRDLHNSL